MGAEPWMYFVTYQSDVQRAMLELRQREFEAGRYFPVMSTLPCPVGPDAPAPGRRHATIEEAREAAAENGTASILDMDRVGDEPEDGVIWPLDDETLEYFYDTARPTRAMVEDNPAFYEDIERGQGVYIILYEGDEPTEICFAGYSWD